MADRIPAQPVCARAFGFTLDTRDVSLLGTPMQAKSTRLGKNIGRVGASLSFSNMTQTISAKLSYSGEWRKNATSHTIRTSANMRF